MADALEILKTKYRKMYREMIEKDTESLAYSINEGFVLNT